MFKKEKTCKVGKADLKENMDSFKECIENMSKMENVKGFLILVDNSYDVEGKEPENKKQVKGMKAACGSLSTLANLVANIDSEIMDEYESFVSSKRCLDGLEELLKKMKGE